MLKTERRTAAEGLFSLIIMSLKYSVGRVLTGADLGSVESKTTTRPGKNASKSGTETNLKYYNTTGSISCAVTLETTRTASRPRRRFGFTALQC